MEDGLVGVGGLRGLAGFDDRNALVECSHRAKNFECVLVAGGEDFVGLGCGFVQALGEACVQIVDATVDADIHVVDATVDADIHVEEATVYADIHVEKAMIYFIEALIDGFETFVNGFETFVNGFEALVNGIEALVETRSELVESLFEASFHLARVLFRAVYSGAIGKPAERHEQTGYADRKQKLQVGHALLLPWLNISVAWENGGVETLGIYVSVPFCRAKCSFCNFASGVFAEGRMSGYMGRVVREIRSARGFAAGLGLEAPGMVDSVYFGGGTPSLLSADLFAELMDGVREEFPLAPENEITVECAPGQVSGEALEGMLGCGVNRLSFGVQSFVDAECAAVGRTHTGAGCREELRRMAAAGVARVGVDLIVGLPGQTFDSWKYTVGQAIESGVEHVSMYMLEVDEGSRLGREKMLGGVRYGAGLLPSDDETAGWYAAGCEWLESAGVRQYEISNFARGGGQSRHNRKYWERKAYLGFGMDAHSMLRDGASGVRWANGDSMEGYLAGEPAEVERVGRRAAFEEALFLGLRLVEGVSLRGLRSEFGEMVDEVDFAGMDGLLECAGDRVRLTPAGRMVSNEVFGRLLEGVAVGG